MVDMDPRPEDRPFEYEEFELDTRTRESIQQIANKLRNGYSDVATLRSHINFTERLRKELGRVLERERAIGFQNDTLIHDARMVDKLSNNLNAELDSMDAW